MRIVKNLCASVAAARATAYLQPMDVLKILFVVLLVGVTLTLGVGIFALFRGGSFGRSYSNKLMRMRVLLQFCAVMVLVAIWWLSGHR